MCGVAPDEIRVINFSIKTNLILLCLPPQEPFLFLPFRTHSLNSLCPALCPSFKFYAVTQFSPLLFSYTCFWELLIPYTNLKFQSIVFILYATWLTVTFNIIKHSALKTFPSQGLMPLIFSHLLSLVSIISLPLLPHLKLLIPPGSIVHWIFHIHTLVGNLIYIHAFSDYPEPNSLPNVSPFLRFRPINLQTIPLFHRHLSFNPLTY